MRAGPRKDERHPYQAEIAHMIGEAPQDLRGRDVQIRMSPFCPPCPSLQLAAYQFQVLLPLAFAGRLQNSDHVSLSLSASNVTTTFFNSFVVGL